MHFFPTQLNNNKSSNSDLSNSFFFFFSWKKRNKRTLSRTKIAKRQKHEKSNNRRKSTRSFSAVITFVEGPPEWPQGICTLPFVLYLSAIPIVKVFVNLSQKVAGCGGRAPTSFLLIIKLYLMFLHNSSLNQNL